MTKAAHREYQKAEAGRRPVAHVPTQRLETHPVYEESLRVLHNLQRHQQADGNQIVVQDDKCQQVVSKII